jgi:hypothetical protein
MIKLDDNLLQELGLGILPPEEKKKMLAHVYETLEMRVGMALAKQMNDGQLNEFEQFINRNDEAGALHWLETNFPNYRDVVAAEFEKLKAEIKQAAPQIVAASQQQAPAATPGAFPQQPQQPPMQQPQPTYQPQAAPQQPMHTGQPSDPYAQQYQPAAPQQAQPYQPQPQMAPQPQQPGQPYYPQQQPMAQPQPMQPQQPMQQPYPPQPPAAPGAGPQQTPGY